MSIKSKEDIEKALSDKDWSVRYAAVRSKHFGPEHMNIALNDEDINSVRLEAVRSEHFGPEHMNIALRDESWYVRRAAIESRQFNTYCYIRHLDDVLGCVAY